jgi:hypothetical protein
MPRWPGPVGHGTAALRETAPPRPVLTATKIEHKIALRTVENADITRTECRVPETDRLQRAGGFRGGPAAPPPHPPRRRLDRHVAPHRRTVIRLRAEHLPSGAIPKPVGP